MYTKTLIGTKYDKSTLFYKSIQCSTGNYFFVYNVML